VAEVLMASQFTPTIEDWLLFIRYQMGIGTAVLPDDSPSIIYAWDMAIALVNLDFALIPGPLYQVAVYNLAGSNLINWAIDVPGSTYFKDLRAQWKIDSFVPGVVQSASDEGTSSSLQIPEFFNNLTLADLQLLKDPWGRAYMAIAQNYGPTVWGLN
jgi:hypothetical protein